MLHVGVGGGGQWSNASMCKYRDGKMCVMLHSDRCRKLWCREMLNGAGVVARKGLRIGCGSSQAGGGQNDLNSGCELKYKYKQFAMWEAYPVYLLRRGKELKRNTITNHMETMETDNIRQNAS